MPPTALDGSLARLSSYVASVSLISLLALLLAWELWLAPLRPGGSWLVLKATPLLFALFGILHGRRYTYQWSSLLIQIYLLEGLARVSSDSGNARWLAAIEILLSLIFFSATLIFSRTAAPSRIKAVD